ncbi:MAG TPA: hypothetical protein VKN36_00430 [Eudoraea sp.]|nr:hypothetical protein [Eudoraea sp.]
MKKTIFILSVASVFTLGTFFISCKTAAQKNVAKKENVDEAKADLKTAQNEVIIQNAENAEEWNAFKMESKTRVSDNNKRIAELKVKMNEPGTNLDEAYAKRISNLEQKNNEMDISLQTFENSKSSDWQIFKRDFNQGMDDIGQSLKDIVVKN